MKCPNCEINKYINDGFEVLECKSSNSNWDDYDQILILRCRECGYVFSHAD